MYKYTTKFITKQGPVIWDSIISSFKTLEIIHGIKNAEYKIVSITRTDISYKTITKKEGDIETIDKNDLIPILMKLKSQTTFTTDSVKEMFKGSLMKKIAAIFSILLACGVIEESK